MNKAKLISSIILLGIGGWIGYKTYYGVMDLSQQIKEVITDEQPADSTTIVSDDTQSDENNEEETLLVDNTTTEKEIVNITEDNGDETTDMVEDMIAVDEQEPEPEPKPVPTTNTTTNKTTNTTTTTTDKSKKKTTTTTSDTKIYDVVDQMPSFPGGKNALSQYLSKNVIYPAEAKKNGLQGTVIVSFIVETNGSLSNIKVANPGKGYLDWEAVRLVNKMPRWNPGKMNGKAVRVRFTQPITFKL